jgi:hypothetical protein
VSLEDEVRTPERSEWDRNTSQASTNLAPLYLPLSTQPTLVTRRGSDDLPTEVKGSGVRWTEGLGYQIQVPLEDPSQYKVYDVEFINDAWYLLTPTQEGFVTIAKGKLNPNQWGTGVWPEDHPSNPKNIVISTAESFGTYLEEGLTQMSGNPGTSVPPSKAKGKERENPKEEETPNDNGGSFRGKAPEIFNGDRTKSKAFISDMTIYMKVNRRNTDIKNPFTRIFIASFIKGPSVVNWVEAQFRRAEENLTYIAGGNEMDEDLWKDFIEQFEQAYVSSTAKEDAYMQLKKLAMKGDHLDEYIADFVALVSELDWDPDGEIACHYFRAGLPTPLVRQILQHEGNPRTLKKWKDAARTHHTRWAMTKAFGYTGKRKEKGSFKPQFHQKREKKERDPEAMDVDFAKLNLLSPQEREELMKSGRCFRCRKQGHMSKECPQNKATANETTMQEPPKTTPKQNRQSKLKEADRPPSYDSLLKQINACSMEDRQRLMEVFSNAGSDNEDF